MQTVIGLFDNAHDAQKAAQELMSEGFTNDNIDVSVRNEDSGYSTGNSSDQGYGGTASTGSGSDYSSGGLTGSSTGSGSDYSSGGLTGGATGSGSDYTSGGLTGTSTGTSSDYASGSNATGGFGGPSGASSNIESTSRDYDKSDNGDSFGDKVSRFFKNLFGGDDDESDRYSHIANRTGCVVTVHAQSKEEAERAADILDDNGAIDVDKRAAEYGYSGGSSYGTGLASGTGTDTTDSNSLNVIREDIEVGKREVQTGGVRLRSRIIERPVEENIRLREERVTVERTPVDRPATTSDFENFRQGEIEMTEYAEVPEVTKQARVVEEVKLSKEVNERTETINETARDTEVDVENLSNKELGNRKNKNSQN